MPLLLLRSEGIKKLNAKNLDISFSVLRSCKFEMASHLLQETLIDDQDPSKGNVAIRVGFHCGPVGEF
jgi:hypothetical protein